MPRQARKYSNTQVYHVIYKGVDNQDIFFVHLVIGVDNTFLSDSMKSLSIKYAMYFNRKYSRSGHLFQNRFKSKCVENQKYFLDVCRYVEQNPEKAGICKVPEYKWNSYHEYVGENTIIDKETLLHYFNDDIEQYKMFTTKGKSENFEDFIEFELKQKMSDDELAQLIVEQMGLKNIKEFSELKSEDFEKGIEFLKNLKYTSYRQISRVIGINQYQLKKYWK